MTPVQWKVLVAIAKDEKVINPLSKDFMQKHNLGTPSSVSTTLAISKLNLSELMEIVPISIDTYKRKTSFNPFVTEKILEIEEVYHKGQNAFGDGFYVWMGTENVALGLMPKTLLSNSFGIRRLLDQIGRMEHGVLA